MGKLGSSTPTGKNWPFVIAAHYQGSLDEALDYRIQHCIDRPDVVWTGTDMDMRSRERGHFFDCETKEAAKVCSAALLDLDRIVIVRIMLV